MQPGYRITHCGSRADAYTCTEAMHRVKEINSVAKYEMPKQTKPTQTYIYIYQHNAWTWIICRKVRDAMICATLGKFTNQ